jgi:signal peptidase I
MRRPASPADLADDDRLTSPRRAAPLAERLRGPWRVAVTESSMRPAIEPGDWLLVDPTTGRWPRRGSIVVFREPDGEDLAIKRVAGRPGDRVPYADGYLILGPDEAWLLSDAPDAELMAAGIGQPVDSRRYGPVPIGLLVGRAWFRYGPVGRVGTLPRLRSTRRPSL